METVGQSMRSMCGIFVALALSFGFLLTPLYAWLWPWDALTLQSIYAGHSILFILHFLFLKESIPWLWSKGRRQEAIELVKRAAVMNGVNLDEFELEVRNESALPVPAPPQPEVEACQAQDGCRWGNISPCNRPELWKRSIIMFFTWFTASTIFFELTYGSASESNGFCPYITFFFNVLVEFPGNLAVIGLAPRLGNRTVLCGTLCLSGVAFIVMSLFDSSGKSWGGDSSSQY